MEIGYNAVNVGDSFISPSRTISEADIMLFAGLTGDINEIHTSEMVAQKGRFGKRIAHGMLTLSMANGLYARLGLFENSVFLEVRNWKSVKPVFLGDTIYLKLTVESKRETKKPEWGICNMKYEVFNQDDVLVSEGVFVRMVPIR